MENFERRVNYHRQRFGRNVIDHEDVYAILLLRGTDADHMLTSHQRRRIRRHELRRRPSARG
jgi:hypothetical protein